MDFVNKQNGPLAPFTEALQGSVDRITNVFHTGRHCRKGLEHHVRVLGDEPSKGGLPRPRWSPQDSRLHPLLVNEDTKRCTRTNQVILTNDVFEALRTKSRSKWPVRRQSLRSLRSEEVAAHVAFGTTRMPSSAICVAGIAEGAPVNRSAPDCVFGNAMTSRMLFSPAKIATSRSMPKAKPP